MSRRMLLPGTCILLLATLTPTLAAAPAPVAPDMPGQPAALTFYGINGYFSGYERWTEEVDALLPKGTMAGLLWTREEIVWANIEPSNNAWNYGFPDDRLWRIANAGYGMIGMLLTTPTWARKPSCAGSYWCPPANVNDYADFVRTTVERYDGDGQDDADGSPRVAYWEIWNEPNIPGTWPGSAAEYAALLKAGYAAVKQADPSAQVLVGSVYVLDGVSCWEHDGLCYLNTVLQADPTAWNAFDILGIHPHMPDVAPDAPGLYEPVTMLSRLQSSLDWVTAHGGGKQVWVTEVAWSTCTAGQGDCTTALSKTQDQQADYLVRTHAMALAKGIPFVATFQLEDKFDGGQSKMWGACSIIEPASLGYAPKKAHHALAMMVQRMAGTTYLGPGPLHGLRWYSVGGRRYLDAFSRVDYRFGSSSGRLVDILWRPNDQSEILSFPVEADMAVTWVDRDGNQTPLTPSGGLVSITVGGHPGYLVQEPLPALQLSVGQIGFLTEPGVLPAASHVLVQNAGGGTLNWTAALTRGSQWFGAAPLAGVAPAAITVQVVNLPGAVGWYTGTLAVDAGAAGHGEVALWLYVAPVLWRTYLPLIAQ